jgi:hypothetical protein
MGCLEGSSVPVLHIGRTVRKGQRLMVDIKSVCVVEL